MAMSGWVSGGGGFGAECGILWVEAFLGGIGLGRGVLFDVFVLLS